MSTFNAQFERQIGKFLEELAPRARSILKRRYGIGGGKVMTLEAIGDKEGITRERVRQIENDAMKRLRKSPSFAELKGYETEFAQLVAAHGGLVAEHKLLELPELKEVKDKNTLVFFLDLSDMLSKRKADEEFHVRWHTKQAPVSAIESALASFARDLKNAQTTYSEPETHTRYVAHAKRSGLGDTAGRVINTQLAVSKHIEQNKWNEYGHASSPFVRPRGMRESSFVVLARAGKPLHFREIAKHIEDFAGHPVHIQTVHNELIKDDRFVLVGRGLYALGEWGYEPGFVKDVLVRLLREKGALSREEILKEVSNRRQVKPSTVFINLQNKKLFKTLEGGRYTLVS